MYFRVVLAMRDGVLSSSFWEMTSHFHPQERFRRRQEAYAQTLLYLGNVNHRDGWGSASGQGKLLSRGGKLAR